MMDASSEEHLRRVLAETEESHGTNSTEAISALTRLGLFLLEQKRLDDAEPTLRRALELGVQVHGPEHPSLSALLANVATVEQEYGRLDEAERLARRAIEVEERADRPNDGCIIGGLSTLGGILLDQGRPAEAEPLYRRALALFERSGLPDQVETALILDCYAESLLQLRRPDEAEPLIQRSAFIYKDQLGEDHSNVGAALEAMGRTYHAQGHHELAELTFRVAIGNLQESLGVGHPEFAVRLWGVADLFADMGRFEEAEEQFRISLLILLTRLRREGLRDSRLDNAVVKYVELLRRAGCPDNGIQLVLALLAPELFAEQPDPQLVREHASEAIPFAKEQGDDLLAKVFEEVLAQDGRSRTQAIMSAPGPEADSAASELLQGGAEGDSQAQLVQESVDRIEPLDEESFQLALTATQQADVLADERRFEEAEAELNRARELAAAARYHDPAQLAMVHRQQAQIWEKLGTSVRAEEAYWLATEFARRVDPKPPELSYDLNDLGLLYERTHRLDAAESYLREALGFAVELNGEDHPFTAVTRCNLARVLHQTDRIAEAERLYRQAMPIIQPRFAPGYLPFLMARTQFSGLLYETGQYEEAEPIMREVVEEFEKSTSGQDFRTAIALDQFGLILQGLGRNAEAVPYHKQAIALSRRVAEYPNVGLARGLRNLSVALQSLQQFNDAEPAAREAASIMLDLRRSGANHPQIDPTLEDYLDVLIAAGLEESEGVLVVALIGTEFYKHPAPLGQLAAYAHQVATQAERDKRPFVARVIRELTQEAIDAGRIEEDTGSNPKAARSWPWLKRRK